MTKTLDQRIHESRRLLQNQYAYLDDVGGFSAIPKYPNYSEATVREITNSRLKLQNPYAHQNESGSYSALTNFTSNPDVELKKRYTIEEIEVHANNLHRSIWHHRHKIWPDRIPSNPIDMLDPIVALNFIGYDSGLEETLGQFRSNGKLIEVAGTIDKFSMKVRISRQFPSEIRGFTAAHELGHALMHETSALHRDRPIDGSSISRDSIEFEADKFATYFLMPKKLVKTNFKQLFLTDSFSLNEATSFALGYSDLEALRNKCLTPRHLSRMLASAEKYNGLQFVSLAKQFRVSVEAMAIRLEEMGLVSI
jgi:hypothetical protein